VAEQTRDHRSFLAAAEKKLLIAIARRLPPAINSDHLTALALLAMALAGACYALARWDVRPLWVAVAALALNWFGDSLDGTLARVRKVERPRYGFYVDHVLDIVGATLLFGGLAASGFMNPLIALALLIGYLLVSGEVFLATSVHGVFRMSFSGFGPTELRILLAAGTIALFRDPYVDLGAWGRMRLFDFGGLIGIAGMAVALTVNVVRNTTALSRLEPRPNANREARKDRKDREELRSLTGWPSRPSRSSRASW